MIGTLQSSLEGILENILAQDLELSVRKQARASRKKSVTKLPSYR